MAVCGDPWMQEYNEVAKLVKDIAGMISERRQLSLSLSLSLHDAQRYLSALNTKIHIFGTRLDILEFHLSRLQPLEEEMNRRKDMVADLRSKLNVSTSANRNSLLEEEIVPANAIMRRATGLDNSGILDLQRQTMRAQDEELEKLLETIRRTNHVAWAINQEFRLHEKLTVDANKYVEVPDSTLQRAGRRLAILNRRTRCGCSCLWLLLVSVTGILVLAALIYMLIKYL